MNAKLQLYGYCPEGGIDNVRQYISRRYPRYLDYSSYHCAKAGIPDEAQDVLHETIADLLGKEQEYLERLYSAKKNGYTELDFLLLRMINLNTHSSTSPYQHKYRPIPANRGVDYQSLKIIDEEYIESDRPGAILRQVRIIRYVFDRMELADEEKEIFARHFFDGEPLKDLSSNYSHTYRLYSHVVDAIVLILYHNGMTRIEPPKVLTERQLELYRKFQRTHKITIQKSNTGMFSSN